MTLTAELIGRKWRSIDIKLVESGAMRVLRWRRGWLGDRLFLDDREIARVGGLFGRETVYGLELAGDGAPLRLLLTVDPNEDDWDFSGSGQPRGVRLESASEVLLAIGSLDPTPKTPFLDMFDNAVRALRGAMTDKRP